MNQHEETGGTSGMMARQRKSGWWLLSLPVIGGMMGWFVMMMVCYVLPPKFESISVIQINGSEPVLDPFGGAPVPPTPDGVTWAEKFQTEMKVITAQQTLERVVERLDLASRWTMAPENALEILNTVVEAEQVDGTDLVKIRVWHTSRQDARDIAEKVVEAYQERRVSMEMDRAQRALNSLDAELRNQEDLVEEKRKVLDTIVQAIGIPYVEGGEAFLGRLAPRSGHLDAERVLGELELEQAELESEMRVLRKMTNDEIAKHALVLDVIPRGLQELRRDYMVEKRVVEEMAKAGMDEGGLELIRQRARVAVLDEELKAAVTGLRESVAVRLEVLKMRVESARSAVSSQLDNAVDRALESHDYVEAKREYESAQAMLQAMKKQFASKRIALKMPKFPVTVHEVPKEGKVPVSPDVDLYLATGKFGGAGIGAVLALLLAGVRRGRRRIDDGWAED